MAGYAALALLGVSQWNCVVVEQWLLPDASEWTQGSTQNEKTITTRMQNKNRPEQLQWWFWWDIFVVLSPQKGHFLFFPSFLSFYHIPLSFLFLENRDSSHTFSTLLPLSPLLSAKLLLFLLDKSINVEPRLSSTWLFGYKEEFLISPGCVCLILSG